MIDLGTATRDGNHQPRGFAMSPNRITIALARFTGRRSLGVAAVALAVLLAGAYGVGSQPAANDIAVSTGPAVINPRPVVSASPATSASIREEQTRPNAAPEADRSSRAASTESLTPIERQFEDGDGQRYPVRNLQREFAGLANAANNGDAKAQRTLLESLQWCTRAPVDAAALAEKVRRLDATGDLAAVRATRALFARCGALDSTQRASVGHWAGLLAESGDARARLAFASVARPMDHDIPGYAERFHAFQSRAQRFLDAEISAGNQEALLATGMHYLPSKIAGNPSLYAADPAKAYAYLYAYSLTQPFDSNASNAVGVLARLEARLTPEQIAHAQGTGSALARDCCR